MDIIDLKREIETLKSFKRRKMLTKVGLEKLTDLNKQLEALTIPVVVGRSEQLSCPNTRCPIIWHDNGECYCTKCEYTN